LLENRFLNTLNETEQNVVEIMRYIKNYKADLKRKNGTITKDYKFANEREWRFVPKPKEVDMVLSKKNYYRQEFLNDLNTKLNKFRLSFDFDDINYIIVNDESEIIDIILHLKKIYKEIKPEKIEILISKIITKEQIFNDF
jgi:hypothetical protein